MRIGLDVGSTTIKAVVLDDGGNICYTRYERHMSQVSSAACRLLGEIAAQFPGAEQARLAVSGSAGMGMAEACGLTFVQEVYATRVCAQRLEPGADVVIELGGEDAKILFLKGIPDARMNGTCAGGTGAFIDQMAALLGVEAAALDALAEKSEKCYTIASRCGVFAKSDIQPLINQGAQTSDVASSIFYAVVNQTIAGLAQGRKIEGNVLY
ncbi:MAG: BadF/BadG/BcrA/BcrD ATPase family protein, partial [Clostridia bacterium]